MKFVWLSFAFILSRSQSRAVAYLWPHYRFKGIKL